MLNVGKIEEGFVLDHIKAGKSLSIYHHLQLDKLDCTVAIIKNARSNKMEKKDILKVECDIDMLDLDVLAFIDHNITVNVIKDGKIVSKKELSLPKEIKISSGAEIPDASLPSNRSFPTFLYCQMKIKKSTAASTVKKNIPSTYKECPVAFGWDKLFKILPSSIIRDTTKNPAPAAAMLIIISS